MNEQYGQPGSMAADAADRVRSIVSAAESEAARIRYEAERDAQHHLRDAETQSLQFLDDAKRRADGLVDERVRRMRELSEQLVERSQDLFGQIDNAVEVRRQLDELVHALGATAERVAREADRPGDIAPSASSSPQPEADPLAALSADAAAPPPGLAEHVREPAQPVPPSAAPAPAPHAAPPAGQDKFDGARLVALQMAVAGSTREEVEVHLRRAFGLEDPHSILDDVFGSRPGRGRSTETRRRAAG